MRNHDVRTVATFTIRGGTAWDMTSDNVRSMRREILATYPTVVGVAIGQPGPTGDRIVRAELAGGRIARYFGVIRTVAGDR